MEIPRSPTIRSRVSVPIQASEVLVKDKVLFTAYYPNKINADMRYELLIYAHLQSEFFALEKDAQKFKREFDNETYVHKTAKQITQIRISTPITIIPECDYIKFNPALLTKDWDGKWVRFDFQFKPEKDLASDFLFVRLSIRVGPFEIAYIKFSIDILEQPAQHYLAPMQVPDNNSLAMAKIFSSKTSNMYQNIFISYSRKDSEVIEAFRFAQLAVGNDVFMDTYSSRTGENWRAALAEAIDKADIFQLFWSKNSAVSSAVREEWEYALRHKCPQTRCEGFIRPVYWLLPMPAEPPDDLKHLSFRYVPLKPKFKTLKVAIDFLERLWYCKKRRN